MSVTPDFIGQVYKDTTTGNIWRANSLTPGDWTLEVQNMQMKWTPTTLKVAESIPFVINDVSGDPIAAGLTALSLEQSSLLYLDIENADNLATISGVVSSITSGDPSGGMSVIIGGCSVLTTIDLSSLAQTQGPIKITGNTLLASMDLSGLVTAGGTGWGGFDVQNNPALTAVDLSSYVPTDGEVTAFKGNALNAASINAILARYVANAAYISGSIDLSAGTNAAPTGQGAADKATLIGRGVTVETN